MSREISFMFTNCNHLWWWPAFVNSLLPGVLFIVISWIWWIFCLSSTVGLFSAENQCNPITNVSVMLQMGEEVSPSPPLHWFPLPTEQLRLRALTDIYLLHPTHGLDFNFLKISGFGSEVRFFSVQARTPPSPSPSTQLPSPPPSSHSLPPLPLRRRWCGL